MIAEQLAGKVASLIPAHAHSWLVTWSLRA